MARTRHAHARILPPLMPPLMALTAAERQVYVRAFTVSRAHRERVKQSVSAVWMFAIAVLTVLVLLALLIALLLIIGFATGRDPLLSRPYRASPAVLIPVFVLVPCIAMSLAVRFYQRAFRKAWRNYLREHLGRIDPSCPGCGYELAGLAPVDGRPRVIRCPECALINPGPPRRDADKPGPGAAVAP